LSTTQEEKWHLKELIPQWSGRVEIIDAEQIRKSKKTHGGGKPRPDVREESWRARERGTGVQSSGQRKRQATKQAREKERQEVKEKQRTLVVGRGKKWKLYLDTKETPDAGTNG
jgi:hypothetical protein